MMIRDTGENISFQLNSHNSTTFVRGFGWGYTVNGNTNNDRQDDYEAGDGWIVLGTWSVTTDQTVTFRLFDTGTSGLGGPTTLSVNINRSSAPSAPTIVSLTANTSSVTIKTADGSNNGSAIDSRQIARNTKNSLTNAVITTATGTTTTITGPPPGSTYYFWARTHNDKGYSPWSASKTVTLPRVPDVPQSVVVTTPTQTSVIALFLDGASNGGSAITGREIGYGTSPTAPQISVAYTGVMTITGLNPGTQYYFFSRVRNAVGWSAYSAVSSMKTIAGAKVNVNGVWKDAVPYVNVGGTWKLARPWGRSAGVWTEST